MSGGDVGPLAPGELRRRRATAREAAAIRRVLRLTARVKALCEQRERALESLAATASPDEVLIVELEVDGVAESRAIRVGRPRGKYVVFAELGLVVNRAATAEDRKAIRTTRTLPRP